MPEGLYDRFGSEDADDADLKTLDSMVSPLLEALGKWFYEVDEGIPILWHDLYYLADKESDDPINGYFHIMMPLPAEDQKMLSNDVMYLFYSRSQDPASVSHYETARLSLLYFQQKYHECMNRPKGGIESVSRTEVSFAGGEAPPRSFCGEDGAVSRSGCGGASPLAKMNEKKRLRKRIKTYNFVKRLHPPGRGRITHTTHHI